MHVPVLRKEVLECLNPKANENFIDCTFGLGGHSSDILEKIRPTGKILGIEADNELYQEVKKGVRKGIELVNDSYVNLENIVAQRKFKNVSGVLFDLGLSSWHLEISGRGFTFKKKEPLDMRYSKLNQTTAEKILNYWSKFEIERILREGMSEVAKAEKIAKVIVETRKNMPIKTTTQLLRIIDLLGGSPQLTFQALRIAVNQELENLKKALPQALNVLNSSGRLTVISFHSLEDRIVKNFFRQEAVSGKVEILTKKPVSPSAQEVRNNPRSRSAKLRCCQKL
ncbi:MAG: 16S rRNA (cytosine1402-N4)-methyltransferase [Parcubacteria group bacterium Gr01-1014_30]|nr:MAG: 16S rRNA (cytosine1402-N4)-methyltransferase [Parcubacteria group bacterium Gr01-1014_30]